MKRNYSKLFCLIGALFPVLFGSLFLFIGLSLGAELLEDPGARWIEYGLLTTLPACLLPIFIAPPMGAGEDLIETMYLIISIPLAALLNGVAGFYIGKAMDRFRTSYSRGREKAKRSVG